MENGKAGLLCEKDGGSTRLKGELEARRLERSPTRLCFGEPRLRLTGVQLLVFGDESALRTEGIDGVVVIADWLGLDGDVKSENEGENEGFENPSLVLDFLVGELKMEGSTFSESSSSNTDGARRLPVAGFVGPRVCFSGEENEGVMASKFPFSNWYETALS